MKKILLSLVMITLTSAIAIGVTRAYFSANGSVESNTVATGTLLLDINKGNGKEISLSNIAPGYTDDTYRWFDAYNKGTLPAEFFMSFFVNSGSTDLYNALNIELRDGGWVGACDGPLIYNGSLSAWVNKTKISEFNVHAATSTLDAVADNIPANYTMRVCQKISFPETGTDQNALQGQSVTFTERIDSTQDANPDLVPADPT